MNRIHRWLCDSARVLMRIRPRSAADTTNACDAEVGFIPS